MTENDLERKFVTYVRKIGGKALKWVSPGFTGVPDRIVFLPGRIIFVELKKPGLRDGRSARQKKVAALLEGLGCTVWRIDSLEEFERRLRNDL